MTDNMTNLTHNLKTKECKLSQKLSCCLDSQYNWTLILATILIWAISGTLMMYSIIANFNMELFIQENIKLLSLLSIGIGFFAGRGKVNTLHIIGLGIGTYFISMLTIIVMRNLGFWYYIGVFVLLPVSIFTFLLQMKYLWKLSKGIFASKENQ